MKRLALLAFFLVGLSTAGVVAGSDFVDLDGDGLPVIEEYNAGTDPLAEDSDGDGLADDDERRTESDPIDPDTDADGLGDAEELNDRDTDPADSDTDGDGLDDGAEVRDHGTDPLVANTDADGLADGEELGVGTDPLVADTDDDGLEDGPERTLGTDPFVADTDDDGLDDGREVGIGSDPLSADTDDDGLADRREDLLGTDLTRSDTDGDGLDDEHEVNGRTHAIRADSDDDGLGDSEELDIGTDQADADTDNDGLEDGWEVAGETDRGTALPDADPFRMDMYVDVRYTEGVSRLSRWDLRYVERTWANFDVENPDGTTGITVHVDDKMGDRGRLADDTVVRGVDDYHTLEERYGPEAGNMRRDDAFHRVVVVDIRGADFAGYGEVGGRFSIVDEYENTEKIMIHELLHNVVGRLDLSNQCDSAEGMHTCNGWLKPAYETFLSEGVLEELRRDGLTPAH